MSENPLFDGNLSVTIGGQDVTAALLPGLSYSNTNPGGFGEATMRLPAASPWTTYDAAVVKGAAVEITHNGTVLFQGEVTNDVSHATVEGGIAFYDVTCAGLWWKAGRRGDFCTVWTDDDPGQWFEIGSGGPFAVDTTGKLDIRLEAGQTAKDGASKSLYYWLDSGMGDPSANLEYFFGVCVGALTDKNAAHWHADISSSDSPWGTWTVEKAWDNETITSGTPFHISLTSGAMALRLRLFVDNDTSTGTTADRYITLSKISVLRNPPFTHNVKSITKASPALITTTTGHGAKAGDRMFVYGTNSSPSIDGWHTVATTPAIDTLTFTGVNVTGSAGTTAGTINAALRISSALAGVAQATGLATSFDLQTGGIGNVNWGLNVRPHMTRADAIEMLAANYPDPIDYGFWESAVFYCKERIAPSGVHDIILDSSAPGIDFAVFANGEESADAVKVLFLFRDLDGGIDPMPDGTLVSVCWPSTAAWSDASVKVDVWDQWADLSLDANQSTNIAYQVMAWIGANAYAGTVTIATPTVPLRGGGTRTTAYIRAGDYIEDSNLATGPLMITSVSVDVDSGVTTLGIGETKAEFVARIPAPYGDPQQKLKKKRRRK